MAEKFFTVDTKLGQAAVEVSAPLLPNGFNVMAGYILPECSDMSHDKMASLLTDEPILFSSEYQLSPVSAAMLPYAEDALDVPPIRYTMLEWVEDEGEHYASKCGWPSHDGVLKASIGVAGTAVDVKTGARSAYDESAVIVYAPCPMGFADVISRLAIDDSAVEETRELFVELEKPLAVGHAAYFTSSLRG